MISKEGEKNRDGDRAKVLVSFGRLMSKNCLGLPSSLLPLALPGIPQQRRALNRHSARLVPDLRSGRRQESEVRAAQRKLRVWRIGLGTPQWRPGSAGSAAESADAGVSADRSMRSARSASRKQAWDGQGRGGNLRRGERAWRRVPIGRQFEGGGS